MTHSFTCRVYYEDTDLAGIVYYANYLKFIERARTEWVRDMGIDQAELRDTEDVVFAVRHLTADYRIPAKFDDVLTIATDLTGVSPAKITLRQRVTRDDEILFEAHVTLVALRGDGRPTRLPAVLRSRAGDAAE